MASIIIWKYCIATQSGSVCPGGKTVVQPFVALVATFLLVGVVGLIYLALRARRGG